MRHLLFLALSFNLSLFPTSASPSTRRSAEVDDPWNPTVPDCSKPDFICKSTNNPVLVFTCCHTGTSCCIGANNVACCLQGEACSTDPHEGFVSCVGERYAASGIGNRLGGRALQAGAGGFNASPREDGPVIPKPRVRRQKANGHGNPEGPVITKSKSRVRRQKANGHEEGPVITKPRVRRQKANGHGDPEGPVITNSESRVRRQKLNGGEPKATEKTSQGIGAWPVSGHESKQAV